MIVRLRGGIVRNDNQQVVIDVQGVGYAVNISGRAQNQLAMITGDVTIMTEMQVREDSMTLFGFIDEEERDAFRLLITVQGVGAKAAMAILSVLSARELTQAIVSGDKVIITKADGVGPKIAQRIVNELSEKIKMIHNHPNDVGSGESVAIVPDSGDAAIIQDALSALVNLGYGKSEAYTAVLRAQRADSVTEVSSLIAAALREVGK